MNSRDCLDLLEKGKSLASDGIGTPDHPGHTIVTTLTELFRVKFCTQHSCIVSPALQFRASAMLLLLGIGWGGGILQWHDDTKFRENRSND